LWNAVLTGLGYYCYQYRTLFFGYFDRYKKWILIFGSFLLLLFLLRKLTANRRKNEPHQE